MLKKTKTRWVTWVNRCSEGKITLLGGTGIGENDVWIFDAEEVIRAVYYRGSREYAVNCDGRTSIIYAKPDENGVLFLTTESADYPYNDLDSLRVNRISTC